MTLNSRKCAVPTLTQKKLPLPCDYTPIADLLCRVSVSKHLGIHVSSNLIWNTHVASITQKATETLWSIRRDLKRASFPTKLTSYKNLVWPTLRYASCWPVYSVWYFDFYSTSIDVTRVTSLYALADIEPLTTRRSRDRLQLLFLMVNGKLRIDIGKYVSRNENRTKRSRHSNTFLAPFSAFKFSLFPRTITDWNALAYEINTSSFHAFLWGIVPE